MKYILYISLLQLFLLNTSCNAQVERLDEETGLELSTELYISEFGQLRINQLNDTLFETFFENNVGHQFDTSMVLVQNDSIFMMESTDTNSFTIRYNWGGLCFFDNKVQVYDFAGYGLLGTQTNMWEIYSKPFYKTRVKHTIKGDVIQSKSIRTIGNVHLTETEIKSGKYYELEGELVKEKWPSAYYSTDESPQGIFGSDTTVIHYRLVMKNVKDVTPKPFVYSGSTINISTGEAAIAWDWADSEAYILDNHAPWTKEEELKPIAVKGILIQNEKGSFLKNWEIIE